jgi:hypothetical protein
VGWSNARHTPKHQGPTPYFIHVIESELKGLPMANMGFKPDSSTQRSDAPIVNDPWFVAVNLLEFCKKWTIPSSFENELLTDKLIFACDEVNQALLDWECEQESAGYISLKDVPAKIIGVESVKVSQYKRAVYAKAKAELVKTQVDLSRKSEAENAAKTSGDLSSHYERMASKAIAKIQGLPAIGVYSI